jgi:hypothetical protein
MNTVELASKILTQLGFSQEPSKELGVDDRRDNIVHLIEEYTHPAELTDEEIIHIWNTCETDDEVEELVMKDFILFARAILRKAQEK